MTNLEIIKYLASNNPTRLAELLDDIYCMAWNCGSYAGGTGKILEECEIDDFDKFLSQDAAQSGLYYDEELTEWSKKITNKPIVSEDWQVFVDATGVNAFDVINQGIKEIKLLESITESEKYSAEVYDTFRREVCANCSDSNCLRSQVEIYDCDKF